MPGQLSGYPTKAYASSAEEARAQADTPTASPRQITQVGSPAAAGEPKDASGADADLIWQLGTLVASYIPSSIDGERLLASLRHSTLGEVIADVAATIDGEAPDADPGWGSRR
jgi:hypothetical protein